MVDYWFTFLLLEKLESTNNSTKRTLRKLVV